MIRPRISEEFPICSTEELSHLMQTVSSTWVALSAGTLLLLASGCDAGGQLAIVRGKVSFKGIPLNTGTIVFTPDALRGTGGSIARAEIGPDGRYVLQTKGLPGVAVGWHRVTVMAMDRGLAGGPDGDLLSPRSLVPEKYSDPHLSGLSCQVRGGQENSIDFDLD
jgi:hypothetical protein